MVADYTHHAAQDMLPVSSFALFMSMIIHILLNTNALCSASATLLTHEFGDVGGGDGSSRTQPCITDEPTAYGRYSEKSGAKSHD